MRKKTNVLATIRSRTHLSIVELHTVARDAAAAASIREADGLDHALEFLTEAERLAASVSETTIFPTAATETRAAKIALAGACEHLRAAVAVLRAP